MRKHFITVLVLAMSLTVGYNQQTGMNSNPGESLYDIPFEWLDGSQGSLTGFRGKKILIVNVASECGYTPQYAQLEELSRTYKDKLVVIGFPCNDFGGQEPGSPAEIRDFCTRKYGVSFPLAAKVQIRTTPVHPLFQWLCQKEKNGVMDTTVKWNFFKFLIDEQGRLIASFPSGTSPLDDSILGRI